MKILFYLMVISTIAVACVFLVKTLLGTTIGFTSLSEKIGTIAASLIVLGLSAWAIRLAVYQARIGAGFGIILVAWVIFIAIMLLNGLLNTKNWN